MNFRPSYPPVLPILQCTLFHGHKIDEMALQVSPEVLVYSTYKLSGFQVNLSVLTFITQVTFNWLQLKSFEEIRET